MPGLPQITATFLIVTPLFLGGARQEAEGFRLASLKGALRFWWRALNYPAIFEHEGSRAGALAALRRDEIALFGDTGSQGQVLMRLEPRLTPLRRMEAGTVLKGADNRVVGPGARYLGYGLMGAFGKDEGKLSRSCLQPGQGVAVTFAFRTGLPEKAVKGFVDALTLFGLVGGLGSRARRGWGSMALVRLEGDNANGWTPPTTVQAYAAEIARVVAGVDRGEAEPPFTAFGPGARIDLLGTAGDGLTALNAMGEAMQRYRAWGHNGRIGNGLESERNFKDDHDWSKDPFSTKWRDYVPQRIVFGLPQNYGKGFGVAPATPRMDRRASPLLLHVHPLGAGLLAEVGLLLPAVFLPGARNEVAVTQKGSTKPRRARIDWTVLERFLDGPADPARRKALGPYFPERTPLLLGRR